MAAPTLESVTITGPANRDAGEFTSVNKPASLAVGDLMIGHISGAKDVSSISDFSSPSGWNSVFNTVEDSGANSVRLKCDYKIATSDDVAASVFDWGTGQSGGVMAHGAIYRITGYSGVPAGASDGNSSTTWVNTITPSQADSLLLFLISAASNSASGSVSGYTLANDNPTWTEQYDTFAAGSADGDLLVAGASAPRSQTSATGDSSATFTTFGAGCCVGGIVVISPASGFTPIVSIF